MKQPRDKKGRFKALYVRPPRKGTFDRLARDSGNAGVLMEAYQASERRDWLRYLQEQGKKA